MSIQGEIDRLSAAKASIAASLQAMGIEPPEGTTLEQYAAQLAAIATAAPWLSIPGGGTMQMGESLGEGPYTIEVTEDGEGGDLSGEQVGYSNTGSGLEATNVQEAIDELAGKGGGEYLPLTGGTMTGPLTLSGLPTSENHAANKRYVDTSVEQALGSIGYSLVKEYTSPGSFTHTFDRKYTDIFVIVVGGGGGGGSVCQNGVSSNNSGGGGGAGGFVACFHVLDSTKIKNRNIVVGAGGVGAPAQSERGATGNGGTGSSSSAFGVTVPGGKGGQGATGGFDKAPNAVGVYSILAGGNGANGYDQSDRRGSNGPIIDILGLTFFSGGGGGGGGGQYSGPRPTGGAGGASGGGSGGSGAITGADATNGSAGSKGGGGGGGAGGGFHDGSTTQKSGIGGKGGDGYVAIYGRG